MSTVKIPTFGQLARILPTKLALSWRHLALLLSAAVALALRFVNLADIPEWFTDEGFWTMPPRDFVLFSHWTLGSYYNHYLSPLYSALLVLDFRLLGPGIVQARLLSAVLGLLTILMTVRLGSRLGSLRVGSLAGLAVAFDGPSMIANRSALLENLQALLLVSLAFAALGSGRSRRVSLALLTCLALLTKLLSAYAAPVVVLHRWLTRGPREALRDTLALGSGFLLAGLVFAVLALNDPVNFLHTWSFEFIKRASGTPQGEGSLALTAGYYVSRSPVLLLALTAASAWKVFRRSISDAESFIGLWLLVGLVAMCVQGYSPQRYFEPLIPFAWLLVFLVIRDALPSGRAGRSAYATSVGVLFVSVVFGMTSFVGYYYVWGHRNDNPVQVAQWINENVSVDQRVLAPFRLVVSTKVPALGFESMPHQPSKSDLDSLRIDYVVTAPETRIAPPHENLLFVEADQQLYRLVARFGEVSVYRVAR